MSDQQSGITRRDMLKRGALFGGAVMWATPVVQTVGMSRALAQPVSPELLFFDDFSGEGSSNVLNYSTFQKWDVTRPTVDFLANPAAYGIDIPGPIVDLDGSTFSAGRIETKATLSLPVGTYRLSFDIAGNRRGAAQDSVTVSLGVVYSEVFNRVSTDPLAMVTRNIGVGSDTSGKIVFDHAGGDNIGILLNSVKLERIA